MRLHVSPPAVDERRWVSARSALCPSARRIRRVTLTISRAATNLPPMFSRDARQSVLLSCGSARALGSIWA
jgi:hypothetical protein